MFLLGIVQLVVVVRDQLAVELAAARPPALRQSPNHPARPQTLRLHVPSPCVR